MSLVSSKDIAKVLKLHKLGFLGTFIGWFLLKILRIDGVNKVYDSVKNLEGKAFFEGLLEKFHLKVEFQEEELKMAFTLHPHQPRGRRICR